MYKMTAFFLKKMDGLLTPSHKKILKRLLNKRLLRVLKKVIQTIQNGNKIETIRIKMLNLGFVERGYEDLKEIAGGDPKKVSTRMAARELALWHGNQYTKEDAEKCLEYLAITDRSKLKSETRRQIAIMRAESYRILGNLNEAKAEVSKVLNQGKHVDLYLAAASLEESEEDKIRWINQVFRYYGLAEVTLHPSRKGSLYDRLKPGRVMPTVHRDPKVTVIMPVYNAEDCIRTALDSVLGQTWAKLEVLVVDDCSTDATVQIVQEYERRDTRVRLIQTEINGGPYVARNLALREASGEFITCHDADDWSHPEKIEKQVIHLLEHPDVIGNTSEQARATSDLVFHRRGKFGAYVFPNMSSFMFRRKPVMEAIGYWDSVRFGADSEFIHRIKQWFGRQAVVDLATGPLSFQRQSTGSLTGNAVFGYHGHFMGVRKEYFEAYTEFHNKAKMLKYEFPQHVRPFPVPEPMRPIREKERWGERRHFDVIIASDFRFAGGSTMSSVEEIKAQKRFGMRTGLVPMYWYEYDPKKKVSSKVRELVDGEQVQILVYGEKVSCDILIVRYPPVLQEKQRYIPDIKANKICVIMNQTPMSDYGPEGKLRYRIEQCARNLRDYFGKDGIWYPIGPLIREALHRHHANELQAIQLAEEDWVNIIDVEQWRRKERPVRGKKIRIGRHSRGDAVKWPEDPKQLMQIYPESDKYEIHVLGGAEVPRAILGRLPKNWRVLEFGVLEPKDFLAQLDVFVYFTNSNWVESFGRVIIEAMAVGVPVILPYQYQVVFGDAAVYAEPQDVQKMVEYLMENDDLYMTQVYNAWKWIEQRYSYQLHYQRLNKMKVTGVK